jgi:hypothetical protein
MIVIYNVILKLKSGLILINVYENETNETLK